jgi:ABC-type multidrug transport system ATPase subunit
MRLVVNDLWHSYGTTPALRGINLALDSGVVALLGPNGSGKTTLLRCLASSLRPDTGEILWAGRPLWPDPRFLRQRLGYLPQTLDFPRHFTPAKLLAHLGQLKGYPDRARQQALLMRLGLATIANHAFTALSGGQIRLAGIAQALLGDPTLLLLDEVTRGLDVEERERVFRQLRRLAKRGLVIFSTHVAEDVSPIAQQIIVLNEGRVSYAGEVEALLHRAAGHVYEIVLDPHRTNSLPPGCRVSRRLERGARTVLRLVGPHPREHAARQMTPTLQDAYLLLLGEGRGDVRSSALPDTREQERIDAEP